ncbi:hypothetical protein VOLCADRAFT_110092 [Volvox carteri f. nagariensis]|uniref:Prefoldin subunit 1 n=1 Tax=Volvox carteri f. nagariensis TaxID=3068 RepID=D8UJ20_VOLCA|nr:uncharacterized protein VOLCADRAFT_110092 [Volvox carteri f. nagariensis]EFJ40257.1 hypothetical protein VOLCADRAFT_110092 [Volvox carteri f. nagariensis]|eukprot:XP_002958654.1 hypothetical protein VOLCADRAFT_110092 [Volvox carteri f. nagariensis]
MDEGDERAIQEFNELQDKVIMQAEMFQRTQQQERMLGIQRQRCVLTKQELQSMPDSTTMYKSIGRAYFCSPKGEVLKELDEKAASIEADAKSLREQRDAIEKKMKDTEVQLRELIGQSPALVRRLGAVKI